MNIVVWSLLAFFEEHWFSCFSRQLTWLQANWKRSLGWQLKFQFSSFIFNCASLCLLHIYVVHSRVSQKFGQCLYTDLGASPVCLSLFQDASFIFQWLGCLEAVLWVFKPKDYVHFLLELATPSHINFSLALVWNLWNGELTLHGFLLSGFEFQFCSRICLLIFPL